MNKKSKSLIMLTFVSLIGVLATGSRALALFCACKGPKVDGKDPEKTLIIEFPAGGNNTPADCASADREYWAYKIDGGGSSGKTPYKITCSLGWTNDPDAATRRNGDYKVK